MGGKSDPPPAPDYVGAANATAAGNADAARIAAKANRVSQYTPYGDLVFTNNINGDPDQWRADITLSPDQQYILDKNNQVSKGMADLSQTGLGYVDQMMQNPFNQGALPAQQINAGQTAQDAIMSRLQPNIERQRQLLETRLSNQGIQQGSEAYQNSMQDQSQRENDLLTQAALQGIATGNQARQQAIQEQAFFRNEPLNTLNAVRTGAQVTNPQFTNVSQQATTAGPDLLGAAQAKYNAEMGAANAENASSGQTMQTVGSLAATAAMFF